MNKTIKYVAVNPNGQLDWVTEVPVEKHGNTEDEALANFLSYITWMDNWK